MSSFERPGLYPYHAESEATILPTVAVSSGYVPSTIADPGIANALGKSSGRWAQYLDLVSFRIGSIVDPDIPYLERAIPLAYPLGSGVANLAPTTTPTIITDGLYLAIDESVLAVAGLNPATFAVNSRTWIYVTPPTAPGGYPVIRTAVVALGTPAAPIGTEIVVGGVDTNGANVTANVAGNAGSLLTLDTPIGLLGDQTMLYSLGNTAASLIEIQNNGAGYAIEITGGGYADVMEAERFIGVGNADELPTASLDPSTNAATLHVTDAGGTSGDQAAVYISNTVGRSINIDSTSTGVNLYIDHAAATGYGIYVTTDAVQPAIYASLSNASAVSFGSLYAQGNDAQAGVAIRAVSRWDSSAAISASTPSGADYDTPAVLGQGGTTSGTGVHGFAAGDGYGVIAESDPVTNPPARASLRIVPQRKDPTNASLGDLTVIDSEGDMRAHVNGYGVTAWKTIHASPRGYVFAFGAKQSGGPIAGGTGQIGDATIYPLRTGDVLVTVTGTLDFDATYDGARVQLFENAAPGTPLATAQITAAQDGASGTGQSMTFILQAIYSLPDTASRTFKVNIEATAGSFDYDNVIVSVQGVQAT